MACFGSRNFKSSEFECEFNGIKQFDEPERALPKRRPLIKLHAMRIDAVNAI